MKIHIHREKYYSHQCPRVPKEKWDYFYNTFMHSFRANNHTNVKKIHSIHIRVNQAYKGCHNFHFYVTINKGLLDEFKFHKVSDFHEVPTAKRYKWLVDLHNRCGIDIGTDKPIKKHENLMRKYKLQRQSLRNAQNITHEYKTYLKLKEKFNNR